MASIDGAPILFVFVSLVGLLLSSPIVRVYGLGLAAWLAWMGSGVLGSVLGSVLFMMAGGSDHAPRWMLFVPFGLAGLGAWAALRRARRPAPEA